MIIDLTEQEHYLLIQTVENASYSGKLAELVVSVLKKLEIAGQRDDEDA